QGRRQGHHGPVPDAEGALHPRRRPDPRRGSARNARAAGGPAAGSPAAAGHRTAGAAVGRLMVAELLSFPFGEITRETLSSLPVILLSQAYAWFFWLLAGLVALQYHRLARMEEALYGRTRIQVLPSTGRALVHGLLGGVLASYLLVFTGVALGGSDVAYLWPVALILMLVHPR